MWGRLRPNSLCGVCKPALGNLLVRFHIFGRWLLIWSRWRWLIVPLGNGYAFFELAPYSSNRCLMFGERGVDRIALLMLAKVSKVHARCALRHGDAVRAVPR